jgi:hypothetical protein
MYTKLILLVATGALLSTITIYDLRAETVQLGRTHIVHREGVLLRDSASTLHAKSAAPTTLVFYGWRNFERKTMQADERSPSDATLSAPCSVVLCE